MMKHTAALKAPVTLEEILNAVTHGVGAALAVAALIGMLVYYADGGVWHTTSCLVYGISLILLYLASTLYHSFTNLKVKSVFKVIDHAAIFVLIAGNYTPFALIPLHGSFGWTIFGLVWGMALVGIVFQCFAAKRFRIVRTLCYLAMGWFAVFMVKPLLETPALQPRHLAPLRHGRQRHPLLHGIPLRAAAAGSRALGHRDDLIPYIET